MPPPPSVLVEDGSEWWRRYPEEFTKKFSSTACPSALHDAHLSDDYFPILGSTPKVFSGKNRRHRDMNVSRFENDTSKEIERTEWGLPIPNREAAYMSLAKYAKDNPALNVEQTVAMNVAFQWMERHFSPYMQNSRVKGLEEVVAGLDQSTSPGFPWVRKYAKKRAMIDDWKEFPQYMADDWDRLKDPHYVAVFGNSLKEEIRPKVKIDANSIRTFTAGPIEMTIHGNRLFEDMNEKFYASHLQSASVVGFSPLKGGWDVLYRKLKRHPNGFALDESQYDSSLRAYLMWGCAQFRWNMLREEDKTPENLERLLKYYQNLVHTVIITSDGVFVRKVGGNPSGSVNTISDNTLILFVLLCFAWIMNAPKSMRNYEAFDQNLALALCGDDNTWTVSDAALSFMNARTAIAVWAEIGITTTTDSLEVRAVEELDFLSAFTVFVDGIAVPLYNRQKILTSLLYSQQPDNPAYCLIRACALMRVGWSDPQLRSYLREFISWLVAEYGPVLANEEEWRQAMCQVPTEYELRKLFLGVESLPMVKQSCTPGIKTVFKMQSSIASTSSQPKRRRARRRNAQKKSNRAANFIGPRLPNGARLGRNRQKKRVGRRQRGGIFGPGQLTGRGSVRNQTTNRKSMVLEEDEYIAEIQGAATAANFQTTAYPVNIGQSSTFPWASGVVKNNFEKYQFEYLEFYVKREVSEYATAGTTGKVMLSFDTDASDAPPATKQQVEDTDPHVDGMPCENIRLVIPPQMLRRLTDGFYIRPAGLPGSTDIKTYDIGNLFVSTQNLGANSAIVGELHVRYRVKVMIPVLENQAGAPINNNVSYFLTTGATLVDSTTTVLPLSNAVANGINIVNAGGTFTPPPGNYLVDFTVQDGSTALIELLTNFKKNGASVYPGFVGAPEWASGVGATDYNESTSLSGSVYVSANGTDTFQLTVFAIQVGGASSTVSATLRWHTV